MKTIHKPDRFPRSIKTTCAALLLGGILPFLAPPASAQSQNLVVLSDTTVTGTHYENVGNNNPALNNTGTWTFTGTNITLSGTAATGNSNGRIAANFTGGGKLDLTDSDITATLHGIQLTNTSAATLLDTAIATTAAAGHGVYLTTSSTLDMTGGAIATAGNDAHGVMAWGSVVDLHDLAITTTGNYAFGITIASSSTGAITSGTITSLSTGGIGVHASNASHVTLQDTVIRSYDRGIYLGGTSVLAPYHADIITQTGHGLDLNTSSTATLIGGTITTTSGGIGVRADSASRVSLEDTVIRSSGQGIALTNTSAATLRNTTISTTVAGVYGVYLNTSSTLGMTGGSITTAGNDAHGESVWGSVVDLHDLAITTTGN
jgi:parallel beta-helix repeat protein